MRRKLIASASAVVLLIFSSCTFQEKYDYQRIMQKTELKSFASLENPLILRMYIPLQFSLKIKPDSVHTKGYKTIYLVYDWKNDIFHDFVYSDVSGPIETFSQELKDSSAVTNHYYISGDKSKVICLNPSGGKPTVIPILCKKRKRQIGKIRFGLAFGCGHRIFPQKNKLFGVFIILSGIFNPRFGRKFLASIR